MEGTGRGLMEVPFQHFPGSTEENYQGTRSEYPVFRVQTRMGHLPSLV
jgi:hypothetical protein